MALDLLKLVLSATSTTTLGPSQNGYYYLMSADTVSTTFPIASGSFLNNAGDTLTEGFPDLSANGYYTVAINGVQQMSDVIAYGTDTLTLSFAAAVTINQNEVIDLQVVDYSPTTETSVTG